jgi:hypothetical protein
MLINSYLFFTGILNMNSVADNRSSGVSGVQQEWEVGSTFSEICSEFSLRA